MFTCQSLVEKVELFKQLPKHLITEIVTRLIPEYVSEGDVILRWEAESDHMYFLIAGSVALFNQNGIEVQIFIRPAASPVSDGVQRCPYFLLIEWPGQGDENALGVLESIRPLLYLCFQRVFEEWADFRCRARISQSNYWRDFSDSR